MYEEFYNLKEKPFNLNPSPRFLYLSDTHKEALALLTYGVMERKGFILLTGEVGTGKTTIVQTLIAGLDKNIQYIFISNPLMPTQDFLDYIAFNTFHKKVHFKSKADFLIEFEEYLKKCRQHQKTFVLIIDEAQTLSYELLEEIRLLTNLESADEKLINIFLIGQPELNDKLREPRCRPILQRINNRYHLKPLDLEGTRTYISTRLEVAGIHRSEDIFPGKTVKVLHEYSEGYPRMINVLADNALLLGYSKEKKKITPAMVKECYEDISIKSARAKPPGEPEKPISRATEKRPKPGLWKWGVFFMVILVIVLLGLSFLKDEPAHRKQLKSPEKKTDAVPEFFSGNKVPEPGKSETDTPEADTSDSIKRKISIPPENENTKAQISFDEKNSGIGTTETAGTEAGNRVEAKIPDTPEIEPQKEPLPATDLENKKQKLLDKLALPPETAGKGFDLVKVKEGDTLTGLSIGLYGRNDKEIMEMIKRFNPGLVDINQISVGQEILFPSLSANKGEGHYTVQIGSFNDFQKARELFQKLIREGNEAYILPVSAKEQAFRVTMGSFQSRPEAERFALELLKKKASEDVEVMKVNLN